MIAWSPVYPRYKKPLGYLRLRRAQLRFFEHLELGWRGLRRVPGDMQRLIALRNIHQGRRAFVLGTGPSLQIDDLKKLRNEVVFGCNGLYKVYDELGWSPPYHTVIDRTQLEDRQHDLNRLTGTTFFAPLFGAYCIRPRPNVIYLPFRWPETQRYEFPMFSEDAAAAVWDGMTVTYSNLQLAFHMGIREVVMLGIDFSYQLNSDVGQGTDTVEKVKSSPDHFIADYYTGRQRFVQFYPDLQRRAYQHARTVFEQHGGRVVNASRQTKLDVLERVDFDGLF